MEKAKEKKYYKYTPKSGKIVETKGSQTEKKAKQGVSKNNIQKKDKDKNKSSLLGLEIFEPKTVTKAVAEQRIRKENTGRVSKPRTSSRFRGKERQGSKEGVKIIPLGGIGSIGMNITAFEFNKSIIVVDCGLAFPEDEMYGIDCVIPDITYIKENIHRVKGFVITHGHEDHIGALPYVLQEINIPIYATRLTKALIEKKLEEKKITGIKIHLVNHGDILKLGDFKVEYIRTNHSIQDASALAITTKAGVIVHTGDFKIDYTPVYGDTIDLQRFGELGKQGVLALLCESTNAEKPGFTMSERSVGKTLDNLFLEHQNSRIIIATFASNVDRVQQIINSAEKHGRKVVIEGRSMVNVIGTATELGYIRVNKTTIIDTEQMKNYPPEKLVLVTTGSQGESMAALSRMAANIHHKVKIIPGDKIIFSSHPIPVNEKAVSKVINDLSMMGADVIFQDAHVSGHACQEEIKLIYALVKPKHSIPIHGEYRHLKAHAQIAKDLGVMPSNIHLLNCGDVLEISEEKAGVVSKVQTGNVLVDGLGIGDVGNIVLRDRHHLAEDGIIIVAIGIDRLTKEVFAGPDIISRGFVYVKESEELMNEFTRVVKFALDDVLNQPRFDWSEIKSAVRDALSNHIWKTNKRRPMILPIIMEN